METPEVLVPVSQITKAKKGRKKKVLDTPPLIIQYGEFVVSFK